MVEDRSVEQVDAAVNSEESQFKGSDRHCFSPSILQEPGTIPIVLEDSIGWPEPVGLC
jgi:hypothetical protein